MSECTSELEKWKYSCGAKDAPNAQSGGERIRTSEGFYTLLAFQASALDHYATPPLCALDFVHLPPRKHRRFRCYSERTRREAEQFASLPLCHLSKSGDIIPYFAVRAKVCGCGAMYQQLRATIWTYDIRSTSGVAYAGDHQ